MFEKIKTEINELVEESKTQIRKAAASFEVKLSNEKEFKMNSIVNHVGNAILPGIFNMISTVMKKKIAEMISQVKKESKKSLDEMLLTQAKMKLNEWCKDTKEVSKEAQKEKELLIKKEHPVVQKGDKLHQKLISVEKPSLFQRVFVGTKERRKRARGYAQELLRLQKGLTLVRLKIRANNILMYACSEIEKYLSTELRAELEMLEGKISEVASMLETELKSTTEKLLPKKGYQDDLHTMEKLSQLSGRVASETRLSLAKQFRDVIKKVPIEKIVETLRERVSSLFRDVKELGALERLQEIFSDHDSLGSYLQNKHEREGSPFVPLSDSLLEQSPHYTTTVGIADKSDKYVEKALESRVTQGSNTVGYQRDSEKIVSLATAHAIPFFALAGFNKYMEAVRIKEREGQYAVYPERRYFRYIPVTPTADDVKLKHFIALGLACKIIKHDSGWFRFKGKNLHGRRALSRFLACDSEALAEIKKSWTELHNQEGVDGVIRKLAHAKEIDGVNGTTQILAELVEKLSLLKDNELNHQRFSQIIQGAM